MSDSASKRVSLFLAGSVAAGLALAGAIALLWPQVLQREPAAPAVSIAPAANPPPPRCRSAANR